MEMQYCKNFAEDDQNDDALSFCDLSLNDDSPNDAVSRPSSPCSDAFQFSIAETASFYETFRSTDRAVLFCGKSIPCKDSATTETTSFSHWKSESFHYDHQLRATRASDFRVHVSARSASVRLPETGKCRYPYQSAGNSSGYRKHYKVLIGLEKLPPRMELADMRRRQSRRRAVVAAGESLPAVAGGEVNSGYSGKGHWGNFVRAWRFKCMSKSNLVSALARVSFGCVSRL